MKCQYCNKKHGLLLDCNYCKKELCSRCINLETHKCANLNDCKKRKRKELEDKLLSEKTEGIKVIKI